MPDILSIAEAGMRDSLRQLNTISNNVANMNTQGYKREIYLDRGFQSFMAAENATGADTGGTSHIVRDFSPAPLKYTGSALDVAIEGDGYFQLRTPQGILLTRDGQFKINQQGQLVSAQGWPVVLNGNMQFSNTSFKILGDGTIVSSGKKQAQLDIVTADPKSLTTAGPGLFKSTAATSPVTKPSYIRQGYLETSNVNTLNSMVNLIMLVRHMESSQQVVRAYGQVMNSAITTLGQF